MWDRVELKTLAKASLKNNYWKAFLISLVLLLATGRGGNSAGDNTNDYIRSHPEYIIIFVAIFILVVAYRILLGYSLEVG